MWKMRFLAMSAVAVVAIVALAILGPWHQPSEALGPDINNDGVVDFPNDILGTILAFQEPPPVEFTIKARPMRLLWDGRISATSQGAPTELVDTSECSEFTAMLKEGAGPANGTRFADALAPNGNIRTSPDGARMIDARVVATLQGGGSGGSSMSFSGAYPYLALVVVTDGPPDVVDVWLFCR